MEHQATQRVIVRVTHLDHPVVTAYVRRMGRKLSFTKNPLKHSETTTVVGTSWCAATMMVRRYLERNEVAFEYHDLEHDTEIEKTLRWLLGGVARHPCVFLSGTLFVEPTLEELAAAIPSV